LDRPRQKKANEMYQIRVNKAAPSILFSFLVFRSPANYFIKKKESGVAVSRAWIDKDTIHAHLVFL
jgi:hypothetical protein